MADDDHTGRDPTPASGGSVPWAKIGGALVGLAAIIGTIFAVLSFVVDRSDKSKEDRAKREAQARTQAEKVSAWITGESGGRTRATIRNTSEGPIHDVVAFMVLVAGAGPRTGKQMKELGLEGTSATLLAIPPGRSQVTFAMTGGGMFTRPGIELAFSDTGGRHWLRSAHGSLSRIQQSPERYYRLSQPVDWTEARPLPR